MIILILLSWKIIVLSASFSKTPHLIEMKLHMKLELLFEGCRISKFLFQLPPFVQNCRRTGRTRFLHPKFEHRISGKLLSRIWRNLVYKLSSIVKTKSRKKSRASRPPFPKWPPTRSKIQICQILMKIDIYVLWGVSINNLRLKWQFELPVGSYAVFKMAATSIENFILSDFDENWYIGSLSRPKLKIC